MATVLAFEQESETLQQPKPLHDKVALVTGGARGIGRAIAIELASRGAAVAINYRSSFAEAETLFGRDGIVELTVLIGYFATICWVMNVARTPGPGTFAPLQATPA